MLKFHMKKSIALFAVLIFIIISITIINKIYNLYTNYIPKNYAQEIVNINNIKTILKNLKLNKSNYDKIFGKYPISSKNGNFRLLLEITPLQNKINLNNFYENNKTNSIINNTLNNILYEYNVLNIVFFKNLLIDTIDKDLKENDDKSEIKLYNKDFQQGIIYNYNHFKKILDYYYKTTKDKNIYNIPWKRYFYFASPSKNKIDCNLIDLKLAQFMDLDIEGDKVVCNKKYLINFDNNQTYLIKVKFNKTSLIYDIAKKRTIRIEKHPIY